MITGYYQDRVTEADGRPLGSGRWRHNTLVHGVWTVVASLLKGDPAARGISWGALGSGRLEWDSNPPDASALQSRLATEVARVALAPAEVRYLDGAGRAVDQPSSWLEAEIRYQAGSSPVTLREFALFGGNAGPASGSGIMINYVVHRRLDLRPGQQLTRSVRLSFRPGGQGEPFDWLTVPAHPLGELPVRTLDGAGPAIATALAAAGLTTIGALARAGRSVRPTGVSATRLLELRAKARLALQTASRIQLPSALEQHSVAELATTASASLAQAGGVSPDLIDRLQEQLAVLQLALDAKQLNHLHGADVAATAPARP